MNRITVVAIVCVAMLAGCQKNRTKASDEIDLGVIENSVYRNEFFGLSMPLPSEWSVQGEQERAELMEMGTEMIVGEGDNAEAMKRLSKVQTVNLLTMFKYAPGAPVATNPGVMIIAEKVGHLPGIKRGKDYHFHTKKALEGSQIDVSFPQEIYEDQLGGKSFDVMPFEITMVGQTVKQKQYAAVMKEKGYALLVIGTFASDEEEAEVMAILKGVTFK